LAIRTIYPVADSNEEELPDTSVVVDLSAAGRAVTMIRHQCRHVCWARSRVGSCQGSGYSSPSSGTTPARRINLQSITVGRECLTCHSL